MNEVESQAHNLKLFIVSDSIGETAQRMIHATLTQFPDLNLSLIHISEPTRR